MADYVALLFGSQNHIHMAYLRYFFGLQLCITSGNYHKGIGVLFVYLPNQPAVFLIGQFRHRAGIDKGFLVEQGKSQRLSYMEKRNVKLETL